MNNAFVDTDQDLAPPIVLDPFCYIQGSLSLASPSFLGVSDYIFTLDLTLGCSALVGEIIICAIHSPSL